MSYPLSILDLSTVLPGQPVAEAVAASVELAQKAEEQGFHRIWFAEHHNFPSIASSATSVLLAHVAAHTERIRLGSGGIMLPNHSPLVIAEQFGTLAEIHPGRIDRGLGRAPGTDQRTMMALRRDPSAADTFPRDIKELQGYLRGESLIPGVDAFPGHGTNVPLYILGSSQYGAQLAAALGLGYSFASHFAPQMLEHAATIYRDRFEPSESVPEPHFIAALNVIAADTEAEAHAQLEIAHRHRIRQMLGRGRDLGEDEVTMLLHSAGGEQVLSMMKYSAVGTIETVKAYLDEFRERVQADELIITNAAPDLTARHRTLELLGEHVIGR